MAGVSRVNTTKFNNLFRSRLAFFTHELSELYRPSINRQKDKLIELIKEKAEKASQSPVAQKMRVLKGFYTLEMAPPTSKEDINKLMEEINLVKKFFGLKAYMHLTVKQAWLLFLVGTEVGLWFFLGETVGKMHIVGYQESCKEAMDLWGYKIAHNATHMISEEFNPLDKYSVVQ